MRWVDLRTGYGCNNTCRFCDQGDRRSTIADAPLAVLADVLRGSGPAANTGVWLAGGEVTLRRDLPALIALCRALGYARVGIQTNGRILAASGAVEGLRRAGLTDVVVALHAPTALIHDHLVGAPGAFQQATAGARQVVRTEVTLHVSTVMTRSITEALPSMAALVLRLRARSHRWITCRTQGKAVGDERALVPRYTLLKAPLLAAISLEREARIEVETVGVPFCVFPREAAVVSDRVDGPPVRRLFPPGVVETPPAQVYGPPCVGCSWRPACPGVSAPYVARWGWEELGDGAMSPARRGTSMEPVGEGTVEVLVDGPAGPVSSRALRRAVVGAAGSLDRTLVLRGEDPWRNQALPVVVREAARLGFRAVAVRGPLAPLAGYDSADLARLDGLSWVEASDLDDPLGRQAAARLRDTSPRCIIRPLA